MKPVASFFNDIFTGKDGESFDMGRLLWAASVLVAFGLQTYDVVWNRKAFDIQAFGIGTGALLAGGGGALGLKAKTEPEAKP